ncbi:hypothetical protein BD408DRAFT_408760 [Parasitella parasitica]|nr:hypothetical protein BD408DRAFT_408760 [Parasitella parasitica]
MRLFVTFLLVAAYSNPYFFMVIVLISTLQANILDFLPNIQIGVFFSIKEQFEYKLWKFPLSEIVSLNPLGLESLHIPLKLGVWYNLC